VPNESVFLAGFQTPDSDIGRWRTPSAHHFSRPRHKPERMDDGTGAVTKLSAIPAGEPRGSRRTPHQADRRNLHAQHAIIRGHHTGAYSVVNTALP
jgi:hypothetical protein